jgi:CheY-like chemotaxis protein
LPYLRRYARALTGSQASGDAYVRASLEAVLAGKAELTRNMSPRIALYRLFHTLWSTTAQELPSETPAAKSPAELRLGLLQPGSREAILLTSVEGFSNHEVAQILGTTPDEVDAAIMAASRAIDDDLTSRVLIIEDEMVIALDLESLVTELGHSVVGIATTCADAVDIAHQRRPDLILADIQLADGSSGVDAANQILGDTKIPVIFITAFPECLLTGERPEPTFLIQKPFSRDTLKATIGQALLFHKPAKLSKPALRPAISPTADRAG